MKRASSCLCLAVAFAAVIAVASPSRAAIILYEREWSVDRSANIFNTDQFDLKFVFGDAWIPAPTDDTLVASTAVSPASVGVAKFKWDATTDPGVFPNVQDRLSNSINEVLRLILVERASNRPEERGYNENIFFLPISGPGNPGLAGKQIVGIEVDVTKFTFRSGGKVNGESPFDFRVNFAVMGVPEPSTLVAGLGMMAAVALRRRRLG